MEKNVDIQRGGATIQTQPQPTQQTAAGFEFPTQVISLPSEGKVYDSTNPLSKGTLEIKYLTAKEEDILADTNLINKGLVLDKLLESVVVEPGVNINDLVLGDKNAILITSRILAFGTDYDVTINDPADNIPVSVTVDLSKIKIKEVDDLKLNRDNEYEFNLPRTKTPIKF